MPTSSWRASVVSDVLGKASRAILDSLAKGETDPERLAALRGQLKAAPEELREAVRGRWTLHHGFLLRLHLDQIDALDKAITSIDVKLEQVLAPSRSEERIATEANALPTRISFTGALALIRDERGRMGGQRFATGAIPSRLTDLRRNLKRLLLPERRSERAYPRAVEIKMSNYPRKRPKKRRTN